MIIEFTHNYHAATIDVEVAENADPAALGCRPDALGLPYCKASVISDNHGYQGMLGWIQLVRSGDNQSGGADFEMDPFSLFENADSPYAFYGYHPTLFDGPARDHRNDMDWLAHSFLAVTPLSGDVRKVVCLAGFSWGFTFKDSQILLRSPQALAGKDWDGHIPLLAEAYPNWSFVPAS